MAMNLPARLCARSAFGPVCGDDRVIMFSRSPIVSCGVGFVRFELISKFYSSSSENIQDLAWMLTLDAETLQSGDQPHRRPVAGFLRLAAGADARFGSERGGGAFPRGGEMAHEIYQDCIEACFACAQECEHCGDACIGMTEMANCVRSCRDCSELCWVCSGYMSRGSQLAAEVCRACARACDLCAAECEKHSAEHCKRCAKACRHCAQECRKMAA